MSLQFVSIDEVYNLHRVIIGRAKTKASVRDFALLHSAVERPKATYGGQDMYPTIYLKAAALLHSLCLNHPFTDGNKRTAWTATHRFLWVNGYHLKAKKKNAVGFMIYVDSSKQSVAKIASWLKRNSRRMRG